MLGAERTVIGSQEVTQAFHWLATRFSNLTDYRFELVAAGASGDLAYTVGYEHITFSMDGGPVQPTTLRVTHLYRREDGEWKTVHRHADPPQPARSVPPTRRRSRRTARTWSVLGPHGIGSRWSLAGTSGHARCMRTAGHTASTALTSAAGAPWGWVRTPHPLHSYFHGTEPTSPAHPAVFLRSR